MWPTIPDSAHTKKLMAIMIKVIMNAGGIDEIVPQSFRLAMQQMINECERHLNSTNNYVFLAR